MLPQTGIQTHLVGDGALGFQVADGIVRLVFPHLVRGVVFVGRNRQVTRERHTYRGDRTADLQIADRIRHVECRRRNPRKAHRRVEERRLGRIGQLRSPVVTPRHREVKHLFPTYFDRGEDGLGLVVPAGFFRTFFRVIEVEDVKYVRKAVFLDRAAVRQFVGLDIVDRGADIRVQRPILAESLVDVHHQVGVGLRVVSAGLGIMAVLAAVGDGRIRRGIEFLRVERIRIVEAHAPGDIQPREDVVAGRKRQHITLLVRVAQVAVVDPVGILHAQVTAFHVRTPELLHEFRPFVVTLEATVKVKILAPREQVGRNQRVRINALVGHVLVFLIDVAGARIELEPVFQKVRSVAEREIVTVVLVVGDDSVRVDRSCRKIGLVLVRTARNRNGVGIDMPRLEIIVRRITVAGLPTQFLTPAVNARAAALAVQPRTVTVLEIRQHERV